MQYPNPESLYLVIRGGLQDFGKGGRQLPGLDGFVRQAAAPAV
jgi:hypothetical protein